MVFLYGKMQLLCYLRYFRSISSHGKMFLVWGLYGVCGVYGGKGNPVTCPRRTRRVSGGIAQLFLNLGTRSGCVWSASRPDRFYPRHTFTGGWVGPGAGLDRCGKPRPTGIRSPDRPARSESLYRVRHPGSLHGVCFPGVTTHCGCIFHSPVADFSLPVFEVS